MTTSYAAIPQVVLTKPIAIKQPYNNYEDELDEQSPALKVMTDLGHVRPATTHASASLKKANRQMIERAVRMLFVVDEDEQEQLQGIITSYDVLGEKPVKHMQRVGCSSDEICVKDLMTPVDMIQVLDHSEVEFSQVGNLIATLKRSGRRHALVAQRQEDGSRIISGIFSLSHINKLMNTQVEVVEIANTFAEVEYALHH